MSVYLGDYAEDATLHFMWDTTDADGASITRATNGTVQVYKNNGVTQSTAGITDTEDFDGLTGIHACTIDLSADAFYATGANYTVVLQGATIDGQTVNAVLAHFSIENRSVKAGDAMDLVADAVDSTSLADNTITAGKYDESTAYPLKSADTGSTEVARTGADGDTLETLSDQVDGVSGAAIADAVWDEARSGHVVAGSFGEGVLVEDLNAAAKASVNAEADTALTDYDGPTKAEMDAAHALLATAADLTIVDTVVDAIQAVTDQLPNAGALTDLATLAARLTALRAGYLDNLNVGGLIASAADLGIVDTVVDAIQAKTDNLPASPAAVGSAMTLEDNAVSAAKIAEYAITSAKIGGAAITSAKLASNCITTAHLHSSAVDKIQGGLATQGDTQATKLAADGLDVVSEAEPSAKPTTWKGWTDWLIQRHRRATMTAAALTVKTEAGATVTTQTISDDGSTQELGAPT